MIAGASIIALCLINKNTNAQYRITGTAGSGTVSVNATTPASTSVMLGGGTGTTGIPLPLVSRSSAFGDQNSISSNNNIAGGRLNVISSLNDNSSVFGAENTISNLSPHPVRPNFIGGASNAIAFSSSAPNGLGGNSIFGSGCSISNSNESSILGEGNILMNGHGSISLGGHNYSQGGYSFSIGSWVNVGTSGTESNIHAYGYNISNNLDKSIVTGFNQRTTVTTQTGLAVQLDPTSTSTYVPTVNFEVQAGVPSAGSTAPLLLTGIARSNIRFHNLPTNRNLPVVLIDPTTGELFRTDDPYYPIFVNDSNQNMMIPELKKTIEEQKIQIANQQKQIDDLWAAVKILTDSKGENNKKDAEQNIILSNKEPMLLYQNVPNPFQEQTSIAYYIPSSVNSAYIRFTNLEGKIIKTIPLTEKGKGLISINAADLSQGIYNYSLYVDGALIDTKKMMLK